MRLQATLLTLLCLMATPLAAVRAGARVEYVDSNREDLCVSFEDFERKAEAIDSADHRGVAGRLIPLGGTLGLLIGGGGATKTERVPFVGLRLSTPRRTIAQRLGEHPAMGREECRPRCGTTRSCRAWGSARPRSG